MTKKNNRHYRIKHKEERARNTIRTKKNYYYGFGKAEYNKMKQQSRKKSYSGLLLTIKNNLHVFDSSCSQRTLFGH